jgi:elongation factor Ts
MIARAIIAKNPASVEELMGVEFEGQTIQAALQEKILTIGENIKIRRFERKSGVLVPYIHGGGTHAVLVSFETSDEIAAKPEFVSYAKDVAMQVAATNPAYLCKEQVPAEAIEKEKEILTQQAMNEGKPQAIAEKMVLGRIGKYYKENCLVEQPFVKDDKQTVNEYTAQVAKQLGSDIKITGFTRYEKGEGLEKRVDDFAAEVASMAK